MNKLKLLIGASACLSFAMSVSAFAGQPSVYGNQMQVQPSQSMKNITLTISGPDGFAATSHSKSGNPAAIMSNNGSLADGLYTWQLTGTTNEMVPANANGLDNGRGAAKRAFVNKSASEHGSFRVINGSVVMPDGAVEAKSGGKNAK